MGMTCSLYLRTDRQLERILDASDRQRSDGLPGFPIVPALDPDLETVRSTDESSGRNS
jgi:hypothetical protein